MPFGFFFLKPKKNADSVKDWLKLQSHYEDAITYLIEKEIFENGLRDLSYIIPRKRNDDYFETLFAKVTPKKNYYNSFMNPEQQSDNEPTYSNTNSVSEIRIKPTNKIVQDTAINFPSKDVFIAESKKTDFSDVDLGCFDD